MPEEATQEIESPETQTPAEMLIAGMEEAESEGSEVEDIQEPVAESVTEEDSQLESEPAQEPEPGLLDRIAELGFQEVETEEEAVQRLMESYRQQNEQLDRLTRDIEQIKPLAAYGKEYIDGLRRPEPAKQEEAKPKGWWNPPEYNEALVNRYKETKVDPETGAVVHGWKENTPAEVRAQEEQYNQHLEQWASDLLHRPDKVLPQIAEQVFESMFDAKMAEYRQGQTVDDLAARIEAEYGDILYEKDRRTGQYLTDRFSGEKVFSASGQAIIGIMEDVQNSGVSNPEKAWEISLQLFNARYGQPETPGKTVAEKQLDHLKKGSTPGRGGSFPPPEEDHREQNPNLSAGQKLLQNLERSGFEI